MLPRRDANGSTSPPDDVAPAKGNGAEPRFLQSQKTTGEFLDAPKQGGAQPAGLTPNQQKPAGGALQASEEAGLAQREAGSSKRGAGEEGRIMESRPHASSEKVAGKSPGTAASNGKAEGEAEERGQEAAEGAGGIKAGGGSGRVPRRMMRMASCLVASRSAMMGRGTPWTMPRATRLGVRRSPKELMRAQWGGGALQREAEMPLKRATVWSGCRRRRLMGRGEDEQDGELGKSSSEKKRSKKPKSTDDDGNEDSGKGARLVPLFPMNSLLPPAAVGFARLWWTVNRD